MDGYPTRPTRDDTSVIGARIGAQIVDSIAVGLIVAVISGVIGGVGGAIGGDAGSAIGGIGLLLGAVAGFVYFFLLEGLWDGYTVGKKLFGIKVVEEDGAQCSLSSAFVRNLLEIIDGLFYYLIGFIAMAASDKRQRLGDRLAGTVVVRETPNDTDRTEDTTAKRAAAP
ncbi:RDD family protein [Halococcus dombrowskii]|uniref:RDD family protein n=1 Tax=Halococcus dombrowskii TaxID=179637 RepID=A0AAV3SEZ3_HALDO|nr:RDD family protein [Halococcus dombrowskii]UOO95132.1 RDD family protein [Halococcus dombrowskii]